MCKRLRLAQRVSRMRVKGLFVDSFEIRNLALDDLHCPVRDVPVFADKVGASIAEQGLANPVIVVRGPREDLADELTRRGGSGNGLPSTPVVNCVYGGTNRVSAARELGYTHIDCILLPTFALGIKLQNLQRGAFRESTAKTVGE